MNKIYSIGKTQSIPDCVFLHSKIKLHVNIDVKWILFLSDQEIEMAEKVKLITSYVKEKKAEIRSANPENEILVNQKHLTNIEIFRKHIEAILEDHQKIHNEITFLDRQLQASEKRAS